MQIQYFKPATATQFVGDCIPFYHDGIFNLYYLLDEGHHNHPIVGSHGGHQWAHASSRNLIDWEHHPLALPLDFSREGSNCTGSLIASLCEKKIYAFYSLRPYPVWGELLCRAESNDGGITFRKKPEPLFGPPEGFGPDFRDPFVFSGQDHLYHMIITTRDKRYPDGQNGCLGHFTSNNLEEWNLQEPLLITGGRSAPECADYFEWNSWYYLLFSIDCITYYRYSRHPFGPWERPPQDIVACPRTKVMKTAPWGKRRIGAGWLPTLNEHGNDLFGGKVIMREIVQHDNGTLGCCLPPEMMPQTPPAPLRFEGLSPLAKAEADCITMNAEYTAESAAIVETPSNFYFSARIATGHNAARFGVIIYGGLLLEFHPASGSVTLGRNRLEQVNIPPDRAFSIEITVCNEIIDVCINGERALIDQQLKRNGPPLTLFAANGKICFEDIKIKQY